MDVKTTFRNLFRDQSVSICMLQYYLWEAVGMLVSGSRELDSLSLKCV